MSIIILFIVVITLLSTCFSIINLDNTMLDTNTNHTTIRGITFGLKNCTSGVTYKNIVFGKCYYGDGQSFIGSDAGYLVFTGKKCKTSKGYGTINVTPETVNMCRPLCSTPSGVDDCPSKYILPVSFAYMVYT